VFVALGIQDAMRIRHIVICGLPRSTEFFRISHKWHDFRKQVTEHKIRILIFFTILRENFLILGRTERYMRKIVHWSTHKVPVILVQF